MRVRVRVRIAGESCGFPLRSPTRRRLCRRRCTGRLRGRRSRCGRSRSPAGGQPLPHKGGGAAAAAGAGPARPAQVLWRHDVGHLGHHLVHKLARLELRLGLGLGSAPWAPPRPQTCTPRHAPQHRATDRPQTPPSSGALSRPVQDADRQQGLVIVIACVRARVCVCVCVCVLGVECDWSPTPGCAARVRSPCGAARLPRACTPPPAVHFCSAGLCSCTPAPSRAAPRRSSAASGAVRERRLSAHGRAACGDPRGARRFAADRSWGECVCLCVRRKLAGGAPLQRRMDSSSLTPTMRCVPRARPLRNALAWP